MPSRILLTAVELGIFEALGEKRRTASGIAADLHSDPRATEVLLDALTALSLLEKHGNLYSNDSAVAELLLSGKVESCRAMLCHTANLWRNWSHLTETVKSGRPPVAEKKTDRSIALTLAMKEEGRVFTERLAWAANCHEAERMLDLGGGCGLHAATFAKKYPRLQVVVFDRDEEALRLAQTEIAGQGLQDRVSILRGDLLTDDLGTDYDLILLSFVISLFGQDQISFVLTKIRESLKPGGRVILLDMILDNEKTHPAPTALFSVNLLVTSERGRAYSFSEIEELLLSSGFQSTYRMPVGQLKAIVGTR
jgi:predicted O-methyltransferase YrrM